MTNVSVYCHLIQGLSLRNPKDDKPIIPCVRVSFRGEDQTSKGDAESSNPFWDQLFHWQKEGIGDLASEDNSIVV
eukprot:gene6483-6246_t